MSKRSPWKTALHRIGHQLKSTVNVQVQPLRSRLLNDPYYRFQTLDEIKLAAELGLSIDVNQATMDDWLRLPGISIHQARSLVALQHAGVQFHALEDVAAALSLPVQQLQGFAPILKFCYYDRQSPCVVQTVPINTASVEQLTRIPAVDLFLARAIVEQRQRDGRFQSMADVQQRLNLSTELISALMHYVTIV